MTPVIHSYEIKTSKQGEKTPVINGVHLHSAYDPMKEAANFVEKNIHLLSGRNSIIILGLGFGYHIKALINQMKISGEKKEIFVIEPNRTVWEDAKELGLLDLENVTIYADITVDELYKDPKIIKCLLNKPTILAHPASFNFYQDYFSNFLGFKASQKIHDTLPFITDTELSEYLSKFDSNITLEEVLYDDISKKKVLNNNVDFLMLAYRHLSSQSSTEKSEEIL